MKVLIAPLDWGLGHTTRCISIINELLSADFEVIIATEGNHKQLLQQEFPSLKFVELKGYHVKYASKRWLLPLKLVAQIPKILIKINYENNWLLHFAEAENINIVISDNRFGFYSKKIFSVFITHQLEIQSGSGKWMDLLLQKINYRFINKFDACWVPDLEKENILAGELSHPKKLPSVPTHYIGLLSRFKKIESTAVTNDLLILLSGPEPQRTLLEKKMLNDLEGFEGKAVLIRGLPSGKDIKTQNKNVSIFNHLPSGLLNKIICESDFVISRSGYTTIMEMIRLQKKTILIPTPGQTEQVYLAKFLLEKKLAFIVDQHDFLLENALLNARNFPYRKIENINDALLNEAISSLKNATFKSY